ncbi:MAG: hypothetical protein JWR09_1083 [Mucilaginibacter sp.]|nr:hypothetical protein [Mucilaginibacter sp.]
MYRDKFKAESYFKESIPGIIDNIKRSKAKTLKFEVQLKDKIPLVNYYNIANGILIYIKRAYSLGEAVPDLVSPAKEMIANYTKSWYPDADYSDGGDIPYTGFLTIVSIGVLLDAKEELTTLQKLVKEVGYKDYLIDFLFKYIDKNTAVNDELLWPDDRACQKLKEITLSAKPETPKLIGEYLANDFYTKENFEDEYNSHKRNDNVYDGYWSFEAAALVKIMDVDDSSFKDNPYYPYDMAHFEGANNTVPETIFDPNNGSSGNEKTQPEPDQPRKKWWQL